jgi:hypothetical protein
MSKRRKNAGEGYGYMFHGAFAKKADAVAKERKTKGAWVKGSPTKNGYRYIVMSPRTNPIKRKKKAPKMSAGYPPRPTVTQPNPTELLVMGANPHENVQEIVLQPGSKLVIRNNPEPRANYSILQSFGFTPQPPANNEERSRRRGEHRRRVSARRSSDAAEYGRMAKSARASQKDKGKLQKLFHEVYGNNPAICGASIGGYPCTRKPGHRGPHLPQGATMRTRQRLPRNWQPRGNPSAEALRERFAGAPADKVNIYDEPQMPAGDYAMLGKMLALYVKPLKGGQIQMIQLPGVIAVANETARQIYFVGGDQDISSSLGVFGAAQRGDGRFELGEARRIDYKQRKEHVPHPESDSWRHEFGEETGVRPLALFDPRTKRLQLEGGQYVIREEGIVN